MTSPSVSTEAASVPAPLSASDKAADFENFLFDGDEPEDEDDTPTEEKDGAEEGEDLELEEEASEDEDEPEEQPAIDAPASLNAEEKKAFAAASPEAQQAWAAAETRRNAQVQEATTKAAERERAAEQAAMFAEAQADQRRAAQLRAFADHFRPQMPSPQLAQHDLASYVAAKAQYDFEIAQFDQIEQQIEAIQLAGQQQVTELDLQQRVADLMTVGKLADPATRDEYVKSSLGLVQELGLDPATFEQVAGSEDFRALEKIAEWKADSEKYKKAVSRKMERVRSGKGKSLRPNAAPQDNRAARGGQDWQRVKTARTRETQNEAFADFLGL